MTELRSTGRWAGDLVPVDLELLRTPLEFILAEHAQHREMCRLAELLAEAAIIDPALACRLARYLQTLKPLHVMDEEHDLFPLLRRKTRRRAHRGRGGQGDSPQLQCDDLDALLRQLSAEHEADDPLCTSIIERLTSLSVSGTGEHEDALRRDLKTYAWRQKQHLALENATVLPLAKACLRAADHESLAMRMALRRGVTLR
jgi:hemerythrin-like domain-containing protein